jgi:arsenate reductase (thioredoxin)
MSTTTQRTFLVVGTANATRSIMAAAYINSISTGQWTAFSAGSRPTGRVNPLTVTTLAEAGLRPDQLESTSWNEFARADAGVLDLVITICDQAANDTSPLWPGTPLTLHWPIPDPAIVAGTLDVRMATFRAVFDLIRHNVDDLLGGTCAKRSSR